MKNNSDKAFLAGLSILSGFYILMILLMISASIIYLFKTPEGRPGFISSIAGVVSLDWQHGGANTISIKRDDGSKEFFEILLKDKIENLNDQQVITKKDSVIVEDGEKIRQGARLTMNELTGGDALYSMLYSPEIQYSLMISLLTCTITALLSLWVAIPAGYLLSRYQFPGKNLIDGLLDIPIVLPPLVVGICLLALFNLPPFSLISEWVVFEIPAIILAQFMVACAFAVRTMRVTFDRIPERFEKVALTLGCTRFQAFCSVTLPQAKYGIISALTLAWARSLGEFGPVLVFAGSTSFKTEVLPTSVFLELQTGSLKGTLVISLMMIIIALSVLISTRIFGMRIKDAV
jgi:molybdate transport system permease protein